MKRRPKPDSTHNNYLDNQKTRQNKEINLNESVPSKNKFSYQVDGVNKPSIWTRLKRKVYNSQVNFKFSSRFINAHVVAVVTLFYFFISLIYQLIRFTLFVDNYLPDDIFQQGYITIDSFAILCYFGPDFCVSGLQNTSFYDIAIPDKVRVLGPQIRNALTPGLIVPACVALVICLLQVFLGIKDFQTHLLKIYRGKCNYLPVRSKLANTSIAQSAFHFGGYVVGYLIWGYIILMVVCIIVAIIITILYFFIGGQIFLSFFYKILPVIVALVLRTLVNKLASNFVFLNRKSKILAVDNFRAYTVFLYFNYYFDCFMGVVSAVIRIIKSATAGLIMMPRIRL